MEITRTDVDDLKRKIAEGRTARPAVPISKGGRGGLPVKGGQGAANRTLAVLSKMFSLAEEWGWRPENSNPCRKVMRYAENKNERFLSSAEIAQLGKVLDAIDKNRREHPSATAAIRILLLTGARLSEIVWLQWQHVDFERGLLHLPDSKTGKRPVFLSNAAIDVLRRQPKKNDNPFVFSSDMVGRPIQSIQQVWQRVRAEVEPRWCQTSRPAPLLRQLCSGQRRVIADHRAHARPHNADDHATLRAPRPGPCARCQRGGRGGDRATHDDTAAFD